ncbi:hypothetical protein Q5P01_001073 [Channa striata]|uniref:Uncharacterized protein n=1 Tax=Channa striata TaxID=64152 RepID=A0AA88NNP5_CHASR|nr:hypothetical protein Q5P01_001073 [Channa striata]
MSEYLKRHEMFINDERLQEELQRLERQLSEYLTKLKNSLLQDGQMSTRGFKIWVNGASFHVQMLIHKVRLDNTNNVHPISAAIDAYLGDLDKLVEEYKTYKTRVTSVYTSDCGDICQVSETSGTFVSSRVLCPERCTVSDGACRGTSWTETWGH